jgi:hypothetical protein
MPSGRPPNWPAPWLDFAARMGGSAALRRSLGYRSKTTLSGKISGATPWQKHDLMLILALAVSYPIKPEELIAPSIWRTMLNDAELAPYSGLRR